MVDFESGKIFVGGISWETTVTTLTEYFSRYGEVSSSAIATNRDTGNPRGFAFVTFADPSSALKALNDHHEISGRMVEVRKAKPRCVQHCHQSHRESSMSSASPNCDSQFRTKKIFVGGLSANVTEEEFKNYFEKFGRITDVVVMYDSVTNRPRGFGFITFDSEDVVDKITSNSFHVLDGKYVEVKRAIPKEFTRNGGQNSSFGGGSAPLYGGYPQENYWPDNANLGFHPATGYGGIYGAGYHMAWPGYGSVGYVMPHWNGLGYGPLFHGPSYVYPMNLESGAGSFGVSNGVDNRVAFGKLVPSCGSNYDVQDKGSLMTTEGLRSNYNRSFTPKTRQSSSNGKSTQRQRSFDRKQQPLVSGDSS